jgi:hypothetical protein
MVNLGKVILGILLASLAATLILAVLAAINLTFTQFAAGIGPEDMIEFMPLIFAIVFVAGGLPIAFLAQVLRWMNLSDSKSCVLAGCITGMFWAFIMNCSNGFKTFLAFPILLLLGIVAGRTYWFVVYRNTEETASLSFNGKS